MNILKEYLKYDESVDTCLVWINVVKKSRFKIGDKAGSLSKGKRLDYSEVTVCGVKYQISHVVLYLHGIVVESGFEVDHINGDRLDNKISNLRIVTHKTNMQNRKKPRTNKTGVTGVFFDVKSNRYHATVVLNGKVIRKYFKCLDENSLILASQWRKSMLELANQVENYTDRHGQTFERN